MNIIIKVWQLLAVAFRPIAVNPAFFIFMYTLGWICCSATDLRSMGLRDYEHSYAELFLDLYVVCILLSLIPQRVRRWVRLPLYAVLYLTAIADVFCYVKFGSTLTPTMLLLLNETNAREAGEFLDSYLNGDVLLSPVGGIVLLMLLNIVVGLRPWRRLKSTARLRFYRSLINDNYRRWSPALGLTAIVLLVYSAQVSARNKEATHRLMTMNNVGAIEHELTRLNDCARLYLPIYRLAFSVYANSLASQQIDKLIDAKNKVRVDSCSFTSPNIVLIIGESYNKHHSQLYGYNQPTTPRQKRHSRRGRLITYTDVVAPWNLTSYIFKYVFSLCVVGQKGEWCDYPLFPELFRKAGYHTTFITNQFLPKARDAVYDFSGGFFLNNPELSAAQFDTRNNSLHQYDEGLLADYDTLRQHNTDHNLIIFHLMGQHVAYSTKYPANRRKFTAADYDRPDLNGKQRRILSDYDNAVLYNDSIVDQIIRRFADDDAVVIYFADHGEECFDGKVNTYGRLHSSAIDARLAREEFEVPMWIWCSHKYVTRRPEMFGRLVAARKRRLMTDALPHLLLYLAGIHSKDYRSEYNIVADDYDELRPRLLKSTADYDQLNAQ